MKMEVVMKRLLHSKTFWVLGVFWVIVLVQSFCHNGDPPNPQPTDYYTRAEIDDIAEGIYYYIESEIPESVVDTVYVSSIDTVFSYWHYFVYDTVVIWNQFIGDTLWMKEIDRRDDQIQYAISTDPLPPMKPEVDTTYVVDVIPEGDNWVYILRGDSLKIYWDYSYKNVNDQPLDTTEVWFHIAREDFEGNVYSLKPFENITQELSLVMKGLPSGDIVPCVSAFILKDKQRVYSTWAKSINFNWFTRRQ